MVGCAKKNEGVIEYKITYKQSKEDNPLINLMPTSMEYYFKDRKILTQIEGWMGVFKSIQISDLSDSSNVLLMKLLDKKYYYRRSLSELPLDFEDLKIDNIEYLSEPIDFKGYKCKQVRIKMADSLNSEYLFYYTNDIPVLEPNRNNPFKEIPGVLMRFNMSLQGLSLQLEFENYRDTVFPESVFKIPSDYKEISREEMNQFFNELNAM
ncbi:MAG: hypothetical protein C0599_11990 [Salinivirgaceae bacterium]|nr:MAG: hypothetical protein C0599_11990 [Salinivirgaceae bacterium]